MRWHVDGVTPDIRKTARSAAQAAGLPLGAWLERAIRNETAAAPGESRAVALADDDASLPSSSQSPTAEGADSPVTEAGAVVAHVPAPRPPRAARWAAAAILALTVLFGAGWLWWMPRPSGVGETTPAPIAETPSPPPASDPTTGEAARHATATPAEAPRTAEQIVEELRREAENGDPMAQHDLALAYVDGRGVPQNYQTAAAWFEKAAAAGLERAQFNLAVLYENALGVPQDFERAFTLYRAAAEQGFAPAQHNLAVAYAEGRGTSRDIRAAALWFRRAADQGIVSAQFNLGVIYERGLAGPPDEQTAYGWYRRAAAGGSQAAQARLAVIEGRIAAARDDSKSDAAKREKPTAAEVADIQRLLARLSFNPGPADGKAGKATREAIRQYQQVAGLPVTGEPSRALLTHLRQVVAMMDAGTK